MKVNKKVDQINVKIDQIRKTEIKGETIIYTESIDRSEITTLPGRVAREEKGGK